MLIVILIIVHIFALVILVFVRFKFIVVILFRWIGFILLVRYGTINDTESEDRWVECYIRLPSRTLPFRVGLSVTSGPVAQTKSGRSLIGSPSLARIFLIETCFGTEPNGPFEMAAGMDAIKRSTHF